MTPSIPYIPETAPFTAEQRAWLNGFLAGLYSQGAPGELPAVNLNGSSQNHAEPLLVLFGSQTGTAEGFAKRVAKEGAQRGFAPRVLALNDYEQANLAAGGKAVIVSSTWGDGDPPDNAANFWSWLQSEAAPRLENLQFAVLGLGDRNYSDFCGASKKFDSRLEALGARRLLPCGECDVEYEAAARQWMERLWDKIAGEAAPPAVPHNPSANGTVKGHSRNGVGGPEVQLHSRANPFSAPLLKNVLLNKPGSAKEVRHYEISLHGSSLVYAVGDALGVVPVNCPELVRDCLATLHCSGDESAKAGEAELSLRDVLACHVELRHPTLDLLAAVARRTPECEFAPLLAPERAPELKQWLKGREVLDLLLMGGRPFTHDELLPLLRKLAPRLYSISSSPKAHPGEVHLTVSAVRYESLGRTRTGAASVFLADRVGQGERAKVFVQPAPGFRPPLNPDAPMIMVGPGTGVAPFRAFLEEREATAAKGANWLFFGDQCRATDFLYEEQIQAWQASGLLTRLELAFSRDQAGKIYVQHRLLENAGAVWAWLERGAHFYVCGDASRMAKDVDAALHQIIQTAGGKSSEDAAAYVAWMKSEKRYQRDVY